MRYQKPNQNYTNNSLLRSGNGTASKFKLNNEEYIIIMY